MARSILSGLGVMLFLTGGLLMGSAPAIPSSLPALGCTGGWGPLAWIVLANPVVGLFLVVLGLFIMFRAGRRNDVNEALVPHDMG